MACAAAALVSVVWMSVAGITAKVHRMSCMSLMRASRDGVNRYLAENFKPPLPPTKDEWDTMLGDPGGKYSNQWLVGVLQGTTGTFREDDGQEFDAHKANPKSVAYATFPSVSYSRRGGVGDDGKLYDPWGREIMFALNSRVQDTFTNNGFRDQMLHTWGMAEYAETKPGLQPFAAWSYGADGVKGRAETKPGPGALPALKGSDDMVLW